MPDNMKYSPEDIERIMAENVTIEFHEPKIKKGVIAEFAVEFPNGNKTVDVVTAFAMDENNHNEEIGRQVAIKNIKEKLWRIVGQYTLATGEKL